MVSLNGKGPRRRGLAGRGLSGFFRQMLRSALLIPVLLLASVEGQEVADWIARHREAMGGAANLAALRSLRAEGTVQAGGAAVRFYFLAARPAAVRVETERGGRTLVRHRPVASDLPGDGPGGGARVRGGRGI